MPNESSKPVKRPRKRSVRLEKEMIAEAGGLCGWCRFPEPLQVHHIDGDPGNTVPVNLIALCLNCHGKAELGFPSPADLHGRKLELQWQRTSLSFHSTNKRAAVSVENVFGGQVAEKIENKTYHGVRPPRNHPSPDSIEANAAMKNYVQYLIGKYTWCRMEEKKYGDTRPFHPAMTKNIVNKAVHFSPYSAPQSSFDVVRTRLYDLVVGTKWARQTGYRPHTWEKHLALLRGEA
jgi:hypothetical protein